MFAPLFWKKIGLSFARAFVSFFVLGVAGAYDSFVTGDVAAGKAAAIALITGAVAAGIRAAQALFTTLESPKP